MYYYSAVGITVYNLLLKMVSTLLVLKVLSLQLNTDCVFPVEFSPKVSVTDPMSVTPTKYRPNLEKAVKFIASADKKQPSLYTRLEMGSNWSDVLDHIVKLFVF